MKRNLNLSRTSNSKIHGKHEKYKNKTHKQTTKRIVETIDEIIRR